MSFGPFRQELLDAWKGSATARDRVGQKLKNAGLSPSDISLLFERLTLERLDENTEWAKVEQFLSAAHALAGQSSHAAAILCHWLYWLAENQERVTQADLIARLADVGRYLHARDGYWRDWFSVIEPLDPDIDLEAQRDRLSNQFQQGMSARYEHILAGCDIPRCRWLDRISAGLGTSRSSSFKAHPDTEYRPSPTVGCGTKRLIFGASRSSSSTVEGTPCSSPPPFPAMPVP